MRANQNSESQEDLRHAVELGWNDLYAGRTQDFDSESIKQCGRTRLALAKKPEALATSAMPAK
jgi:hypothetical protein